MIPYPKNITSFTELAQYINAEPTHNMFGLAIIFLVFFVAFLSLLKGFESKNAFLSSTFITMLTAIILRVMNLLTDTFMFASIILCALGIFWVFWTE